MLGHFLDLTTQHRCSERRILLAKPIQSQKFCAFYVCLDIHFSTTLRAAPLGEPPSIQAGCLGLSRAYSYPILDSAICGKSERIAHIPQGNTELNGLSQYLLCDCPQGCFCFHYYYSTDSFLMACENKLESRLNVLLADAL